MFSSPPVRPPPREQLSGWVASGFQMLISPKLLFLVFCGAFEPLATFLALFWTHKACPWVHLCSSEVWQGPCMTERILLFLSAIAVKCAWEEQTGDRYAPSKESPPFHISFRAPRPLPQ